MPTKRPHASRKTCGAKTRGDGGPCRQRPMANGRCRLHGGKSTGPKTLKAGGRYSQKVQEVFQRIHARAELDSLFDLRPTVALLLETRDACIERGIEQGDTPGFRKEALKMAKDAQRSIQLDARGGHLASRLDRLIDFLEEGYTYDEVLAEAAKASVAASQRIESARAADLRDQQAVTMRQFGQIMDTVYRCIAEEGGDRAARIMRSIERIYLPGVSAACLPAETVEEAVQS